LNERLPQLGADPEPPWSFSGWQIPYLVMADSLTNERWGYYLSLWLSLRLPDEAIPRIEFTRSSAGYKALQGVEKILFSHSGSQAWRTTLEWLGWSLGVLEDTPYIPDELNEELYRSFSLEAFVTEPSDHLGLFLAESMARSSKKASGFFPTPIALASMMADMTFSGDVDSRLETLHEPCIGTGAFLLAASNHTLAMSGCDINPDCVLATRIQGALYAPWITWGIPRNLLPAGDVEISASTPLEEPAGSATTGSPVQLALGLE